MSRAPSAPLGAPDDAAADPTAVYVRAALDAGQLEGLYFSFEPGELIDAALNAPYSLANLGRSGRDGMLASPPEVAELTRQAVALVDGEGSSQ